jgi:hypothetical protein
LTACIDYLQKLAPSSYYSIKKDSANPMQFHNRFGGAL